MNRCQLMKPIFQHFILCLLFCAGTQHFIHAQTFGGNPAKTKWRQVNNAAVKVIYPVGMDSVASRVAAVSLYLQQQRQASLGEQHKQYSIVLQSDVNYSNAYVMMGPRRSEFFMMPPQNPLELGSMSWADNLAIHEYRHVQQYNNFNVGLSRFMGGLFGQQGQALANALSVPDWFFEGDAVWNETVHSGQGRGRLPLFLNAYTALNEKSNNYSFMQMRNGSLRKYYPNHYDLGYLLVSYGRQQFGDDIWRHITHDAAAFKSLFYPMQAAVKKHTGQSYRTFVQAAMQDFRQKQQANKIEQVPIWITNLNKKAVTDYKYPYPTKDGKVVVLKSGYADIPTFVLIEPNGKEQKIAVKDIGYDDYFGYNNGRIVYSALQADARWGNRDYSIIRLMDVASGEAFDVSGKGRYFSPDIHPDGAQLVTVEHDPIKGSRLLIMNTEGALLHSLKVPADWFLSHPKFLPATQEVLVAVRQPSGSMGWLLWQPGKQQPTQWLLPPANRLLAFPVVQGDTIYYTQSEGGKDALFAIIRSNGMCRQMTAFTTGVYQGFANDGQIVAAFFTADGYRIGKTPVMPAKKGIAEEGLRLLYVKQAANQYSNLNQMPTTILTGTKYRKFSHPFNFHSWQPIISQTEYTATLLGNNVLNTVLTNLSYTYNTNERSHTTEASWRYGGWYVQPLLGAKHTWGRDAYYNTDTTFQYNQSEAYAGLFLPLNFTKGKMYRSLTASATVNTDNVSWQGIGKGLLRNLHYTFFNTRLSYTAQIQKARQQIYPRYAHALLADYRSMIDGQEAWQLLMSGSIYLPGIGLNHSLVLSAAWQARDTMRQYAYTNSFPFSRGYNSVNFPRMFRLGANYHFPLFYPDWGFGNLLYFQRIRANVFYDYTRVKSLRTGATRPFSTVGTEIYFDTRWWNQLPVSVGVRYSYLLDRQFSGPTQPHQWELVLPVNLF